VKKENRQIGLYQNLKMLLTKDTIKNDKATHAMVEKKFTLIMTKDYTVNTKRIPIIQKQEVKHTIQK
jgi:hypothetical protein